MDYLKIPLRVISNGCITLMLVLLQKMNCKCPPTGPFEATFGSIEAEKYWRGASIVENTVFDMI